MTDKIIDIEGGYAVIKDDTIWIPAVWTNSLSAVLKKLYDETKIKRIIFSAILNAEDFKKHLKNIKREWDEYYKEIGDYSHCIEIEYQDKEDGGKYVIRP